MASIALAATHSDTSSIAALLLHVIAWLGIVKGTLLILWPKVVLAQARHFGKAGFLHGAWVACAGIGIYFTWFGYCGTP